MASVDATDYPLGDQTYVVIGAAFEVLNDFILRLAKLHERI